MPLSNTQLDVIALYEDMLEHWDSWEEIERICVLRLYNKLGLPLG